MIAGIPSAVDAQKDGVADEIVERNQEAVYLYEEGATNPTLLRFLLLFGANFTTETITLLEAAFLDIEATIQTERRKWKMVLHPPPRRQISRSFGARDLLDNATSLWTSCCSRDAATLPHSTRRRAYSYLSLIINSTDKMSDSDSVDSAGLNCRSALLAGFALETSKKHAPRRPAQKMTRSDSVSPGAQQFKKPNSEFDIDLLITELKGFIESDTVFSREEYTWAIEKAEGNLNLAHHLLENMSVSEQWNEVKDKKPSPKKAGPKKKSRGQTRPEKAVVPTQQKESKKQKKLRELQELKEKKQRKEERLQALETMCKQSFSDAAFRKLCLVDYTRALRDADYSVRKAYNILWEKRSRQPSKLAPFEDIAKNPPKTLRVSKPTTTGEDTINFEPVAFLESAIPKAKNDHCTTLSQPHTSLDASRAANKQGAANKPLLATKKAVATNESVATKDSVATNESVVTKKSVATAAANNAVVPLTQIRIPREIFYRDQIHHFGKIKLETLQGKSLHQVIPYQNLVETWRSNVPARFYDSGCKCCLHVGGSHGGLHNRWQQSPVILRIRVHVSPNCSDILSDNVSLGLAGMFSAFTVLIEVGDNADCEIAGQVERNAIQGARELHQGSSITSWNAKNGQADGLGMQARNGLVALHGVGFVAYEFPGEAFPYVGSRRQTRQTITGRDKSQTVGRAVGGKTELDSVWIRCGRCWARRRAPKSHVRDGVFVFNGKSLKCMETSVLEEDDYHAVPCQVKHNDWQEYDDMERPHPSLGYEGHVLINYRHSFGNKKPPGEPNTQFCLVCHEPSQGRRCLHPDCLAVRVSQQRHFYCEKCFGHHLAVVKRQQTTT